MHVPEQAFSKLNMLASYLRGISLCTELSTESLGQSLRYFITNQFQEVVMQLVLRPLLGHKALGPHRDTFSNTTASVTYMK